jgi:hypothetical protein
MLTNNSGISRKSTPEDKGFGILPYHYGYGRLTMFFLVNSYFFPICNSTYRKPCLVPQQEEKRQQSQILTFFIDDNYWARKRMISDMSLNTNLQGEIVLAFFRTNDPRKSDKFTKRHFPTPFLRFK